ncbi:unnamed protein product, partial [Medioppia subpectinata]
QSFRCFASIDGRIESLQFVDTNANTVERFDQLVSRFDGLSDEWKNRVIYISGQQLDTNLWPTDPNCRLIVMHIKHINLKHLDYYRQNVLILNGFDVRLETIIADFFNGRDLAAVVMPKDMTFRLIIDFIIHLMAKKETHICGKYIHYLLPRLLAYRLPHNILLKPFRKSGLNLWQKEKKKLDIYLFGSIGGYIGISTAITKNGAQHITNTPWYELSYQGN